MLKKTSSWDWGGISTGKDPVLCKGKGDHNGGLEGAQHLHLQPKTGVCIQSPACESCFQLCLCTMGVSVLPRSPLLPAASLTSALLLLLLALPLPPPPWQGAPCRWVSLTRASWTCR